MNRIGNDELLCEVIRRVRGRKLSTGGYEGAGVQKVLEALQPLMTDQEITVSFRRLLARKHIVMTGFIREHDPQARYPKDEWFANGIVSSLHPDLVLKRASCYFSPAGSLLREARRNGKLKAPSHKTRYLWFKLSMCYVAADGLPQKIERQLTQPPLPQPMLPDMVG